MKPPLRCLPPRRRLHENQLNPFLFAPFVPFRGYFPHWLPAFEIMSASRARLEALTKDLRIHWQETKEYWSDAKAHEFEHKYLEELFTSVDRAVSVIDQLDKLMAKIKKDCE